MNIPHAPCGYPSGETPDRPSELDPQLQQVVDRTRARLAEAGELYPPKGHYEAPLDEGARTAVMTFIRSSEYCRLADEVARDDPEVADL
jgi:hypothetical protein